ncbi:MAG: signal peptidase II, partial [Raoultibacter sp.]
LFAIAASLALAVWLAHQTSKLAAASIGLLIGGAIGNAIDRFTLGYVVDFIDFTFIDFPVFNVADIGVTCGFVIFIAAMLLGWRKADQAAQNDSES